ncbi:NADPH:quinone reductase [Rhodococcus rhodochrous]|uniref:NADPH:quinone reductase n=1 Tax=Rhodococcus rhodochrous TaxID=1829 RepID=UPI00188C8830|nr:NADPH:quinone reductase [Rhodococcus rhodochrous]MBF4479701.1 NADPH:quinone reductase [Rhodococcus rhodochrous]
MHKGRNSATKRVEARDFGDESVLDLVVTELDLGPGQVRVELWAVGVNPADTYVRAGGYEFLKLDPPFGLGFDASGVILETGPEVTEFREGDRVWVSLLLTRSIGTYAEELVCNVAAVRPLPSQLSFRQGSALGLPYVTAYRALFQRGGAVAGETVLVHGASGGVGIAAVQLAVATGLNVIGTASTQRGRDIILDCGAGHVLDHDSDDYMTRLRDISPRGVDLIIEMRADRNLAADVSVLAPRGRVVIVGSRGEIPFQPRGLMVAEADVRGMAIWNMTGAELTEATDFIVEKSFSGEIVPRTGAEFPLTDVAEAHRSISAGTAGGRVVLLPRSSGRAGCVHRSGAV